VLRIYTLEVTPFAQNARILFDDSSQAAVLVDPGGDLERIFHVIGQLRPARLDILLTHAHLDHAGGVARGLQMSLDYVATPPRLLAHREPLLRGLLQQSAKHYHLPVAEYQNVPDPDVLLEDGDTIDVGRYSAAALYTPGHAPDHLAFYFQSTAAVLIDDDGPPSPRTAPILLAGDALFRDSIGRTDLPGGSFPLLIRSIREQLLTLPPETIVLCGHGPETTIGREIEYNPFLQD
jgi:glyoxylase-like metal-dependent hydrolase (beta-lactamase superfamily II)